MNTFDFGVPSQYNIRLSTSPVFECALDIAAFTREEIHDKLDRNLDDLRSIHNRMSDVLKREVTLSSKVHSWRNLLLLAHRCPYLSEASWEKHISLFLTWMQENKNCLIELAAPYLGEVYASELKDALSGNTRAQQHLIQVHSNNPVVHLNLHYLFSVESHTFCTHIRNLLNGWYKEIVLSDVSLTMVALEQDKQHKQQLAVSMTSSELIRAVTKGSELQPLPGIDTLWLIPQYAYRPFTIINYLPQCVVYYYPAADEFLPGGMAKTQMKQVAALHKALGDVQRLRLLKLIRFSPKSLNELTERLHATKSNVHHHLTLLRTAGLVQVENGVYSMNQNAISHVGDELRELLDYK